MKAKTYLICIVCLFVTITVIFLIITFIGNSCSPFPGVEIEKVMSVRECIFSSMGMGYVICGIFTGITLFVRILKKIPPWIIALLCIFFPITFLFIELAGLIMVLPETIISVRTLSKAKEGKDKNE